MKNIKWKEIDTYCEDLRADLRILRAKVSLRKITFRIFQREEKNIPLLGCKMKDTMCCYFYSTKILFEK